MKINKKIIIIIILTISFIIASAAATIIVLSLTLNEKNNYPQTTDTKKPAYNSSIVTTEKTDLDLLIAKSRKFVSENNLDAARQLLQESRDEYIIKNDVGSVSVIDSELYIIDNPNQPPYTEEDALVK